MKRLIATTAMALIVAAPAFAAGTNTDANATTTTTTPPAATMSEPSTGEKVENATENAAESTAEALDAAGEKIEDAADAAAERIDEAADRAENAMDDTVTQEGWVAADFSMLTNEQLEGVDVYDASNEEIGEVVQMSAAAGAGPEGAVIDVGGFLGLGEHRVMIPTSDLKIMRSVDDEDDFRVFISATREELEAMPEYEI